MTDSYFFNVTLPTIAVALFVAGIIWSIIKAENNGYEKGYKQGQIDAMNGKIKFELKKNDDGETVYEEIKTTNP